MTTELNGENTAAHNKGFGKSGVSVLRINICGKIRHLLKAEKRYRQA